jgi:hypothetical protein
MFSTVTERPVLLVGSIPLSSVEEVFEKVSSSLGRLVRRIPDGEIGDRATWISWQRFAFKDAKGLIVAGERKGADGTLSPRYAPETTPANVEFPALGYAREALASYRVFAALRDKGKIAAGTRFQVSLPTPLAVVFAHVMPDAQRALWPRYESCLFAEVDQMSREIPHRDLAIQWDIAVEINGILEVPEVLKKYSWDDVIEGIVRAANRVPEDVELGLHLCYGDPGHKHVLEPRDTGLMVEMANRLEKAIRHPITWLHMPVPRDRDDDGYFAPLSNLRIAKDTELYLGLVHFTDGIDGAMRRLTAAQKFVKEFGIATECGFGRRPSDTIPALLSLHREIAALR